MGKRRRLGDDGTEEGKRRRKMDVSEICQELYDTIKNHKTEEGRVVCETFIRAPKRRSLADYYEVVNTPMDLLRIQQKIKMEEYDDVEQLTTDVELLVNNAKAYYKDDTQEHKDAIEIWDVFQDAKSEFFSDEASSSNFKPDLDTLSNAGSEAASDDESPLEELFSAVMTATDENDGSRTLSSIFRLLPPKSKYPDYYEVITEPIDLKIIATKIQNNVYNSINELEKDFFLMVKNAKNYNEPGSQIYKDANTLRKIITAKKNEIDQRKFTPLKASERIRAKKQIPAGQKWSSYAASLNYEDEVDNMEIGDDSMADANDPDPEDVDSNPLWQLFDAVRSPTNPQGIKFSDPFWRLPSRHVYPDYYKEIKKPVSLAQVKKRIKSGVYKDISDMIADMNQMFENAKRYNQEDSQLYKDANKLQKIMLAKAKGTSVSVENSDLDDESSQSGPSKKPASATKKKSMSNAMTNELKKARNSALEVDLSLKKKMKFICKSLVDHVDESGRALITVFMERPSRRDYPDYYRIIENPIDMKTIEGNVKWDRYSSEEAFLSDLRLMFANCKHYNEEGSQIYVDAQSLESVLAEKIKEASSFSSSKPKKSKVKVNSHVQQKMRRFYDTLMNHVDLKGRQLSSIFMKLPSKTDYPDYYEVIKKPIDLDKIGIRLKNGQYETLEDVLADFVLMFDNACKYNEPDSQIYKDALVLQHVALQTKLELAEADASGLPDVKAFVQDLLTNLFTSLYNHQDEEGRCYSDSINELSDSALESSGAALAVKPLTFDTVKKNLDKGRYRRLDRFQQDIFAIFDRVRALSRTDSQAFEDSAELQAYFIRLRNELCKNGDQFQSPALTYTEADLNTTIEALKIEKCPREQQEASLDAELKQSVAAMDTSVPGESLVEDGLDEVVELGVTYRPGDFVYIEPREKLMEPHIMHIEKLTRDASGEIRISGIWFYRPNETFHIATKRFLEKEVFRGEHLENTPLSQVVGKCFVMCVKDYFRMKPEGFEDKDVYVCESRYFTRVKTFKKLKAWPYISSTPLTTREYPLPMIRVQSVFKDVTVDRPIKEDPEDGETSSSEILDVERPNVICEASADFTAEEGAVFYEQFTIPCGSFKLGDCCYVRTDQGRNLICRIDGMWVDKEGSAFFHGPWFVQQVELPPLIPRVFFSQEVFLSSIEDTNPLLSICGKCSVLEFQDFITRRPTELPEAEIYICDSKFLEHEKKFEKLTAAEVAPKISYANPSSVIADEYYVFRKPLAISRYEFGVDKTSNVVVARKGQPSLDVPSPQAPRPSFETENEESNDIPSVLDVSVETVAAPIPSTPTTSSVKKKITKRLVTGYIIFASEVRKSVVLANPECNFGDISRIIGTEWKNLNGEMKAEYERKAQKQNEESAKEAAREAENIASVPGYNPNLPIENGVLECRWAKCDFQFEEQSDLHDHLVGEPNGHVWQEYGAKKDSEEPVFQCLFMGCGRVKKGAPPFPSITRLVRHCKEVHVTKQQAKPLAPSNRTKNYVPSKTRPHPVYVAPPPVAVIPQVVPLNPPPQIVVQTTTCPQSPLPPVLSKFDSAKKPAAAASAVMPVLTPFWVSSPAKGTGVQAKPIEPIFVAPPKPNRLLHTSTYIKYIEGLRSDSQHITNWEKQLNATPENTTPDRNRLPVQWLANGSGNHGTVVNALWALRNFMMQDSLNLWKH